MSRRQTGFSYFQFLFFGQRLCFLFAAKLKLSLKFMSSSEVISLINLLNKLFFSFTCFLTMQMNIFFSSTLVEINSQRIRRGFTMLCDSTDTPRILYRDSTESLRRLHRNCTSELIRSGVAVKFAKVWERHKLQNSHASKK